MFKIVGFLRLETRGVFASMREKFDEGRRGGWQKMEFSRALHRASLQEGTSYFLVIYILILYLFI